MQKTRRKTTRKAFTLVELLVVIAIVAVLATVTVVSYVSFIKKADISNDEAFLAQVNNYLSAYAVGKGELTDADIEQIVKDTGLDLKVPHSAEYGYGYYYNTDIKEFELVENDIAADDSKYVNISGGTSEGGASDSTTTTTTTATTTQAPNTNPDIDDGAGDGGNGEEGGSNEPELDPEPEEEPIDYSPIITYNEGFEQNISKNVYAYGLNGTIYVGFNYEGNKELDLSEIASATDYSGKHQLDVSFVCTPVRICEDENNPDYLGFTRNGDVLEFDTPGIYNLTITATDEVNGTSASMNVEIRVKLSKISDAYIDTSSVTYDVTKIDDTTYRIDAINKIRICESNAEYNRDWNDMNSSERAEFVEKLGITVSIGGENIEYQIDKDNNKYYIQISDLQVPSEGLWVTVSYSYLGMNGAIAEASTEVPIRP